jgi:hypothetical protein
LRSIIGTVPIGAGLTALWKAKLILLDTSKSGGFIVWVIIAFREDTGGIKRVLNWGLVAALASFQHGNKDIPIPSP